MPKSKSINKDSSAAKAAARNTDSGPSAAGASKALLEKAEVSPNVPSAEPDAGVIISGADPSSSVGDFIKSVAMHRHPERETDPPMV